MSFYTMTLEKFEELYSTEEKARLDIEHKRWPNGPVCPHCGATRIGIQKRSKVEGYYRCKSCQSTFTVRTCTLFQRSHIPLHTWLIAMFVIEYVYRKTTSYFLKSDLGLSLKSACFLLKRYRTANSRGEGRDNQIVPKELFESLLADRCEEEYQKRLNGSGC